MSKIRKGLDGVEATKLINTHLNDVTRIEVIDANGRSYVNWKNTNKVKISLQDNKQTLKIFID